MTQAFILGIPQGMRTRVEEALPGSPGYLSSVSGVSTGHTNDSILCSLEEGAFDSFKQHIESRFPELGVTVDRAVKI